MSKDLYVFSTLSAPVDYVVYVKNDPKQALVAEQTISVAGGANVVGKGPGLVTPRGVATRVTEEQADALRSNQVFQMHEANGYVTIGNHKVDPEQVATDMTTRDESAPLVPEDFEAEGVMAPIVGAPDTAAPAKPGRKA